MINDRIVIDGIAHAWNLEDDNIVASKLNGGAHIRTEVTGWHENWNPAECTVPRDLFVSDWSPELVARTLFLESDLDIAVHHHLSMYSYFRDGLVGQQKNAELARRWPDRFLIYAGVDPTAGLQQAMESLKRQVDEIPSTLGLKLYPVQIEPLRSFRLDDEDLFPLWELVRDLGLKVIAVHKAMPTGPVPMNPFSLDDVEGAASVFTDIQFEVMHGGMAFAEETSYAIARYPNVFTNLEVTSALLNVSPNWFEDLLAQFIFWGGVEKVIWGDGAPFIHPQPLLEKFMALEFSEATQAKYGVRQITLEDKHRILGGNYAAMVGLDEGELLARIADDEFSQERRERGIAGAYSYWRGLGAGATGVAA